MPSKYDITGPPMERRDFLKKAGAACALAAGAGVWALVFHSEEPVRRRSEKIYTFKDFRVPVAAAYPKIAVARGLDALKMVRAAVDKLGGMSNFIEPGQRVLIKPNVGWDRQPEQAANTNPEVVAAVVRLCLEARAASVVVTDVSINDPYRSFARSGIEAAVNAAGGKISFTTENDFLTTDLKGEALNIWPVSRYFHEADRLINVPVVKNHSLSKCTAAMKNWYGVLGGRRNRLHQDLDTSIADLAAAIRPTLTIMDVTRVLKHNGPTGGNLSDVSIENTIAAGTDEVALDSYCLRFLDLKVEDVGYLIKGRARGIGTTDLKGMNIVEVDV